ncbi:anaerobic ribonucleoside-triphosphate reductase [Parapedobacter koreensis]|uniref:Anaerobic ribonucleoside-triphosphate reductase n=1 Tax=Parapedobacter koreensis TaxID=332977 RepID=A0A1H7RKD2_9SPHI|nr:anaerobic ribonucleoside-triphosphate reductase [Parapedobacter koreensis]SEL59847.1 Anaerobic ribonucleoside-triphosphate reductase [Parapedobacter koreensis]
MNIQQQDDLILQQNQERRSKCLVYTRVMGYHRPVESFNIGKKGEHGQRRHFAEKDAYAHL